MKSQLRSLKKRFWKDKSWSLVKFLSTQRSIFVYGQRPSRPSNHKSCSRYYLLTTYLMNSVKFVPVGARAFFNVWDFFVRQLNSTVRCDHLIGLLKIFIKLVTIISRYCSSKKWQIWQSWKYAYNYIQVLKAFWIHSTLCSGILDSRQLKNRLTVLWKIFNV